MIDDDESHPRVLQELIEVPGGLVSVLTINRPEQMNPIDGATLVELEALLTGVPDDVRVVIITGKGRAFSAGGDLSAYVSIYDDPEAFRAFLERFGKVCDLLTTGKPVTISMINGACVAGGLEMALACDLVVAAESARIGDGHLRFGQLPGAGGSQRLPRAIGPQRSRYWILSGQLFSAEEAFHAGLVAQVFPDDQLKERTVELAARIAGYSALTVARARELAAVAAGTALKEGLRKEMDIVHDYATTSTDAREGLHAFLGRRAPNWQGS
jgi:enoyl-CoA hydratase/carnithine racemase